jgi:hypothetical protein
MRSPLKKGTVPSAARGRAAGRGSRQGEPNGQQSAWR